MLSPLLFQRCSKSRPMGRKKAHVVASLPDLPDLPDLPVDLEVSHLDKHTKLAESLRLKRDSVPIFKLELPNEQFPYSARRKLSSSDKMMLSRAIDELHLRGNDSPKKDQKLSANSVGSLVERRGFTLKDHGDRSRRSLSMTNELHIYPHQYTADPTVAWEMLKTKRPVKLVRPMALDTPIKASHVRFVTVACTHGYYLDPRTVPMGDVLIVAGDFTTCGLPKEIRAFNDNMGKETKKAKELALKQALQVALSASKISNPKSLLTNCFYLQDSQVNLFGLTIYGTPWQPTFDNWAFNLKRGQQLLDKWNQIPSGVDVLVTHTPPLGHGDLSTTGVRTGCVELLNSCRRIRPKYHVFGHIHEGYGCTTDGYTKFINCSMCNNNLEPENLPVIFDVHLPTESKQFYIQQTKKSKKCGFFGNFK